MSNCPKRQHFGKHENDERQDHNTDTPLRFVIPKETIECGSRLKFVVLMRLKKNEIGRIEGVQVMIVRGRPKKALIWSLIMDDSDWNAINSMNSIKSGFTPKWGRNFGREKESTNSVQNMTKFSFDSTILLRGTWTS